MSELETVELDLKQKARLRNVHPKPSEMGILEEKVTQDWFGESDTLESWALFVPSTSPAILAHQAE